MARSIADPRTVESAKALIEASEAKIKTWSEAAENAGVEVDKAPTRYTWSDDGADVDPQAEWIVIKQVATLQAALLKSLPAAIDPVSFSAMKNLYDQASRAYNRVESQKNYLLYAGGFARDVETWVKSVDNKIEEAGVASPAEEMVAA